MRLSPLFLPFIPASQFRPLDEALPQELLLDDELLEALEELLLDDELLEELEELLLDDELPLDELLLDDGQHAGRSDWHWP